METWSYAGKAGAGALLVFSLQDTTIPVSGIDLLFPEVLIPVGNLDQLGLGEFTLTMPPLPLGTQIYSQLVTVQGPDVKATDVATSTLWF